MLDEFTRQNRIESVNSLKESIVNLKSAHEELVVTTQAFKESIAKEKELFGRVLAMEVVPQEATMDTVSVGAATSKVSYQTVESVTSISNNVQLGDDDSAHIEGIMSTEKVPTVKSR